MYEILITNGIHHYTKWRARMCEHTIAHIYLQNFAINAFFNLRIN